MEPFKTPGPELIVIGAVAGGAIVALIAGLIWLWIG